VDPNLLREVEKRLPTLPPEAQQKLGGLIAEARRSATQQLAKSDFMAYVTYVWPSFIHGRHHEKMAEAFQKVAEGRIKRLIINMPPRHAILTSMQIPTTGGMKSMGDLRVGDYVFGPDGAPVRVLGKSETFKDRPLYRVTTDDGAALVVDGEHLWTVRLNRKRGVYHDYTTEQLWRRQNGEVLRTTRAGNVEFVTGRRAKNVRLPRLPDTAPVQYPASALPIDPYVLGVWLGDGSSASSVISGKDADAAIIRAEFARRGVQTTDQATRYTFDTLGLLVKLKELGVLGNKHIPRMYLEASPEQRRDLLKGLMDTDGNVSKAGQCFFAQSNRAFIDQVVELIRSLGVKASVIESEARIGDISYGPTWKISFYAADVCLLPRKEIRTLRTQRAFGRYITIEQLPELGDTQCIKVDREDGLFLAGEGYLCTHNTKSEFASYLLPSWFLGKYPGKKIIQTSHTAELAVGFGRKVRNLVDSDRYKDIFPEVALQVDSKAAGRWATNHAGEYFAIGVGGAVTGKGADLLIIDDPHALPLDTVVPTPHGFVTIKALKVGDEVYGPDGLPTKVLAKSAVVPNRKLCRVVTDDGEEVLCDEGHLWSYHTETALKNAHIVKTATARELAAWDKPNKPCLPRHAALQYPTATLAIPPYVLGAWLGDGTSSVGRMTAHPHDAPFMRQQFSDAGYVTTDLADAYCFGVQGLWTQLKHAGLLDNKHIPEAYMTASQAQRMALLQGLMDTDGNVTTTGECSFNNCNEKLARQVRELVHSLGVKAKMRVYYDARPNHNPVYRVNFKLADCCRMPRKRERTYTPSDKRRRSFTVTPTDLTADVQCITVDRKDGLFLVGRGYVVTHNSEQEATLAETNPEVYDKTYEWYTSGPRQRLQPGGSIVIVATRWSKKDLVGQVLKAAAQRSGEEWEVIEFPAILPSGNPLWPEFWKLEELEALKQELPNGKWMAQYQQQPTSDVSAIVKRDWWRLWDSESPPFCQFIIQSWDTAFLKSERADYSACTTWGVFDKPDATGKNQANIILLNAFKERMEFPELKQRAFMEYEDWRPDSLIVEAKAAGSPLLFELRAMGIPVQEFTPSRGNDKIARLNAVADLFASGRVWVPNTHWAEELVEEVASFPSGEHDDLVDSMTQALLRYRQGGFLRLDSDEPDPVRYFKRKREGYY
jgi:predicted phage terminase large subunit-like protein